MLDDLNDLLDKLRPAVKIRSRTDEFMTKARRVLPGEPAQRRGLLDSLEPPPLQRFPQQPEPRQPGRGWTRWRSRHLALQR